MIDDLPPAEVLLGDKDYDADWFHEALARRGIEACIPSKSDRKEPTLTIRRSTVSATRSTTASDIKDWRRIQTRYDRCAHAFKSAIRIAATIIVWL